MYKLLATLMLVAPFALVPAGATMTCDPVAVLVCTGDSGEDLYASCDGVWADAWAQGEAYVQVCAGHDGTNHLYVCPLAGDWQSPNCEHQQF